jgi:VWFA-related protein
MRVSRAARYFIAVAVCRQASLLAQPSSRPGGAPTPPTRTAVAPSPDKRTTFSTQVDLVVVPVVVRDVDGHAVGSLTKEDFRLFDKGKLQTISQFSVEKSASETARVENAVAGSGAAPSRDGLLRAATANPTRFVVYVFDDLHIGFEDLVQVRAAAVKHLKETLRPTDRAAIYTTSGIGALDFTNDRDKLIQAVNRVSWRARQTAGDCPPMTFYEADLIQNRNDRDALAAATADVMVCERIAHDPAQEVARAVATRELAHGESDLKQTLSLLKDVVRRLSSAPGERTTVLISPGFPLTTDYRQGVAELMDRAIRAHVIISSLSSRGIPVLNGRLQRNQMFEEEGVLADVADGTGGTFFHNSNGYGEGLRRIAAAPEFIYLLGFSPSDLKYDGSFHAVKVTLRPRNLSIQARLGYFAAAHAIDREQQTTQEIQEALFSREEVQEFPVTLNSMVVKPASGNTTLSMRVHIDVKNLPFQKVEDRENDTLTIVYGLFDGNGKLLRTVKQTAEMNLKQETFDVRVAEGFDVKNSFDVEPGKYVLRVVVRDSEGQMMSARNGDVEIP